MDNGLEDSLNEVSYTIDHSVIFYPAQHRLVYQSDGEEINVKIFIPTSRCLRLLLEGNKKIIRREDFINKVWIENGCYVANNTFYQNISMLRKLLKNSGLNEDTIITIPKRGLKINGNTHVEISLADRLTAEENALVLHRNDKKIPDNNPLYATTCHRSNCSEKSKVKTKIKAMLCKSIISSLLLGGAIGALMAGAVINLGHSASETPQSNDTHSVSHGALAISKKSAPIRSFEVN